MWTLRSEDDIYLDILGRWLPRAPASWAVPMAAAAFLCCWPGRLSRAAAPISAWQWSRAFAITPALLFVAAGSGFLLHTIAAFVSGTSDPSYAYPAALRIGLALGLAGSVVLVSRFAPARAAAVAGWLWIGALGLVVAIFLPGLSPYFIIPAFVAGLCMLVGARTPGGLEGSFGAFALFIAALVALLIWSSIGATGESVMGLKLHPMFTVPFAIALSAMVPLFALFALPRTMWAAAATVFFAGSACAAVVQGLQPAFSASAAQRLNISYVENRERAFWTVDAMAPVPPAMRAAAAFSLQPRQMLTAFPRVYAAPAGNPRFPVPDATIIATPVTNGVRRVTLLFHGADAADQMQLIVPKAAMLKAVDLQGRHFPAPASWSDEDFVVFACMSRDCRNKAVTLTLAGHSAVSLGLYEHRFGLPDFAGNLVRARPATAVQSQNGDGVTLVGEIHVPAT